MKKIIFPKKIVLLVEFDFDKHFLLIVVTATKILEVFKVRNFCKTFQSGHR